MRIPVSCAIALAGACLAAAAPLRAQADGRFDVTGRVVDVETNAGVAGAVVELSDAHRRAVTDASGAFTLTGVRAGTHHFAVTRLGYVDWGEDGEVAAGDEFTIGVIPRPQVLQGVRVVVSQLERRRRATSMAVRVLSADEIHRAAAADAYELVRDYLGMAGGACPATASYVTGSDVCVNVRGRLVAPGVFIDEKPAPGGLAELAMLPTQDVYTVESYEGGMYLRVITNDFAARLAERKAMLDPFAFGSFLGWVH